VCEHFVQTSAMSVAAAGLLLVVMAFHLEKNGISKANTTRLFDIVRAKTIDKATFGELKT